MATLSKGDIFELGLGLGYLFGVFTATLSTHPLREHKSSRYLPPQYIVLFHILVDYSWLF